jgi:hypothetical protein
MVARDLCRAHPADTGGLNRAVAGTRWRYILHGFPDNGREDMGAARQRPARMVLPILLPSS